MKTLKLATIEKIVSDVRIMLENKYNGELRGKCIEASEVIVERLKAHGIHATTVEGWCVYDNFESCSNRPYDEHTWVSVLCGSLLFIDVTATQFQPFIDVEIAPIIVGEMPYYFQKEEPDEKQLEIMGW